MESVNNGNLGLNADYHSSVYENNLRPGPSRTSNPARPSTQIFRYSNALQARSKNYDRSVAHAPSINPARLAQNKILTIYKTAAAARDNDMGGNISRINTQAFEAENAKFFNKWANHERQKEITGAAPLLGENEPARTIIGFLPPAPQKD